MSATSILIDLNVRVRGNLTYAGFEDASRVPVAGERVDVRVEGTDVVGSATVVEVDEDRRLIYLDLVWVADLVRAV